MPHETHRSNRRDLAAALLAALGLIAASLLAASGRDSIARGLAAIAILGASTIAAAFLVRRPDESYRGVVGAAVVSAVFVLMGTYAAFRDPRLVTLMLPVLGASAWVGLLRPEAARARACRFR